MPLRAVATLSDDIFRLIAISPFADFYAICTAIDAAISPPLPILFSDIFDLILLPLLFFFFFF